MKRVSILSVMIIFAFCGVVYAAGVNGQYKGHDIVRVKYEGKELKPDDVPGMMLDGRTMVPLGLLRKAGFTVEWDQKTLTANVTTKKTDPVPGTPLTIDQVKELGNRVALIYSLDTSGRRTAQGSGFIVNPRGLLITAYHVAEKDGTLQALEVQLNGKTYNVPAGVYVFADQQKDIFGVYLQDPDPLPFLEVSEELPESYTYAFTISNPKAERNVVTEGMITAAFKSDERTFVNGYFDAKPGSSGGAVLNEYGEVVGVITDGFDGGITFSTSILEAKSLYDKTFK